MVTALKKLKNNKAPGQDNLNAELFKIGPETAAGILEPLLRIIWTETCVPKDWIKRVIIKIPKKIPLLPFASLALWAYDDNRLIRIR